MLKILYGPDWRETRKTLLHTVMQAADALKGSHVLIVPDQFSHSAERALLSAGGDRVCRYAEVLSFSRLAERVFSIYGGAADVPMDNGGRLIAAAASIEQIRSRLKIYGACAAKPEFLRQLLDTLDECKAFRVTSGDLAEASRNASGVLGQKLEEISLLLESYEAVCANGNTDPSTRLMKLLRTLLSCDYARGKHFYFEGFSDFNALETDILAALLEGSEEVTLCLLCDDLYEGQAIFDGVRTTLRQIERIAERLLIDTEYVYIPGAKEAAELTHLKKFLFSGVPEAFGAAQAGVCFASYPDEYSEVVACAGTILRLLAEGFRCRDICVACGDMGTYQPIFRAVFSRYQIPAYFSGSEDILAKPVIRTVLSALDAATDGMEADDVFAFLKSGIDLISADRCSRLENYVLTWGITGKDYRREWTMPPGGYGEKADPEALALLNEDRALLGTTLVCLKDRLFSAANTGEMVLALYDFLEKIDLSGRLTALAEASAAQGQLQRAQEYQQLYGIVISALEQLYNLLSKTVRTPEEFTRLLRAMLSEYRVGTIPATLDAVSIGSVMAQRQNETKILLLLGANDGCFPASPGQTGLLSESERKNLQKLGVSVAPGSIFVLTRELHGIYNVLCGARQKLFFSAVKGSEAFLFLRLGELFEASAAETFPLAARYSPAAALELASALKEDGQALAACIPDGLPALRENLRKASHNPGDLSKPAVEKLYGERLFLSASRVDHFAKCRLSYFLNYGLRAKERRKSGFDAANYGSFVHYVLEQLGRQIHDEGGFRNTSAEHVAKLTQQYIDEYIRQTIPDLKDRPERFNYLFERNLSEVREVAQELFREMQTTEFTPEGFEVRFADDGALDAISIVGKHANARLEGAVDRVDVFRAGQMTYLRVVDYKTGRKDFDLTDILNGVGLQMLIYLFTLEQGGQALYGQNLAAGGVLYFPARMELKRTAGNPSSKDIEDARNTLRRRKGLLLDDPVVLGAMEQAEKPVFMPFSFRRDGTTSGSVASVNQFTALRKYLFGALERMTDEIASGLLTPNPYWRTDQENACRFCPYQDICHVKADVVKKRLRREVKPDEFWQKVEAEEYE